MSSFSSGNGERPTVPPEYDSQARYADVFLYDYDTTGFALTSTYKHWALVFQFEDGAVRVIEGKILLFQSSEGFQFTRRIAVCRLLGVNFHGLLLPSFTKVKDPSAKFNSRKGSVTISPKQIRDLVINNPYNSQTYNVITCNCQNWINVILKKLGFVEETTVGVEAGWTFVSLGVAMINPVIGAGVFLGRRLINLIP
uniref:Uncharacterized protein n=1 Tax=Rhodnius prolixus TaxID=13249 RepID=T1HI41_RHOPR